MVAVRVLEHPQARGDPPEPPIVEGDGVVRQVLQIGVHIVPAAWRGEVKWWVGVAGGGGGAWTMRSGIRETASSNAASPDN